MTNSTNDFREEVVKILSERYESKLMNNTERSDYVEVMIAKALGSDWKLTWQIPKLSAWTEWDIENINTEKKIEVKQSASCQLWKTKKPSPPQFSIKEHKGRYRLDNDGYTDYIEFDEPKRIADLYIFAWHGIRSRNDADHRQRSQWEFYVVPSGKLPKGQHSIGLNPLKMLANSVRYEELADVVMKILSEN